MFWTLERVPGEVVSNFTTDDQAAVDSFKDTYARDADGRYRVQLPCFSPQKYCQETVPPELERKGNWEAFSLAVQEYPDMGHAELKIS